jgi:hypothetical protein
MDKGYINRHLVIDRYLQGKLMGDEEAEFEERLVWDRELIDEVDLAASLRAGLRSSGADSAYVTREGERLAWRLKSMVSMPRYAAAASFVMGVLLTSMLMNNKEIVVDGAAYSASPTTVVPLLVLRGSNLQTIQVQPDGMTVLMVDVPLTYPSYRVSVRREDAAEPFWTQDGLVPGYLQQLAVGVPGSALSPATYFLTIEGVGEETNVFLQEITFETVATE